MKELQLNKKAVLQCRMLDTYLRKRLNNVTHLAVL